MREEYGAQYADGNSEYNCSGRYINASDYHREYSEEFLAGSPFGSKKEFAEADLRHRRESVGEHKQAYRRYSHNGHAGAEQEHYSHYFFSCSHKVLSYQVKTKKSVFRKLNRRVDPGGLIFFILCSVLITGSLTSL